MILAVLRGLAWIFVAACLLFGLLVFMSGTAY